MVLGDSSIWIDHLRHGVEHLIEALRQNQACMHPMVIGELACGHLKDRETLLHQWIRLPRVPTASHDEVMFFIERQQLMGTGIGYVDAHLLAACKLNSGTQLWTRDKRLAKLAKDIGIAFQPHG